MKTALHDISEGFSLAAIIMPLLSLTFPAAAMLDGAGEAYLMLSLCYLGFAVLASLFLFAACMALSELFDSLANPAADDTKALHAYLLNGGRA